jgi:hypothetical protein
VAVLSDGLRRRLAASLQGTTAALADARQLLAPQRAREVAAALAAGRVKAALLAVGAQRDELEAAQRAWGEQASARAAAAAAEAAARAAAEARGDGLEAKVRDFLYKKITCQIGNLMLF